MSEPRVVEMDTPSGRARVHVWEPPGAVGVLALGHGAGPSTTTVDLVAAREAATGASWAVALVEQPWLVAGGRVAPRPPVLDAAWVAAVDAVVDPVCRRPRHPGLAGSPSDGRVLAANRPFAGQSLGKRPIAHLGGPLVVAGRSAGARVACRTALELGAVAVVCLSFPLHPPGRPERSRAEELAGPVAAGLPVHVVQGSHDPFGGPGEVADAAPGLAAVHPVEGTHTIPQRSADAVRAAVASALAGCLPQ